MPLWAPVQASPARIVTSRGEWEQYEDLGAPLYHSWSWTAQSVARLKRQVLDDTPVSAGYLRIWIGGSPTSGDPYSVVGCPIVFFDGRMFNTPRASPAVIVGTNVCATCAVLRAEPDLELFDDSEQVTDIAWTALAIDASSTASTVIRTPSDRDWAEMAKWLVFPGDHARTAWFDAVRRSFTSSGWVTVIERHVDRRGRPFGWIVQAISGGTSTPIAAARVGQYPPPWGSTR